MSLTLLFSNDTAPDTAKATWEQITSIADQHGLIEIENDTVSSIARLLDGVSLSNGELVSAYPNDEDDHYEAVVFAFGPSLLSTYLQDAIRTRLAAGKNGKQAAQLFDLLIRLEICVSFTGKDHCFARMTAVNRAADLVDINRTHGNMSHMLSVLGIDYARDPESSCGETDFETFRKAVAANGHLVDCEHRLNAFVACAARHQATTVYWA